MTRTTPTGHTESTPRRHCGGARVAALLAAVALAGAAVAADGPAATTTATAAPPTRLGAAAPASGKGGLAAFAARAELKGSTDESGKIAISNGTLAQTSGGGTLSIGGGVTASSGVADLPASDVPAAPSASETWDKSLAEQQKKVEAIEKDLADFDQRVAASTDPYYGNNPHGRAPGQADANELTREQAAKQLAAEKARLDEMKRQARREGATSGRK